MKDLDFDELDRAVNSLLTNKSAPAADKAVTPLVDLAASSDSAADEVAVVVPSPSTQPAPLAARRSSGRFMDVVHPSSDMRTTSVPAKPVSREGVGVVPSVGGSVDKPTTSDSVAMSLSEVEEPELPVSDDLQPVVHEWPDPIDFNSPVVPADIEPSTESLTSESRGDDQSDPIDDDKDINQIAEAINKTLSQDLDSQAPLESPFLSDTKVEKRPLGAFSTEAAAPVVDDIPAIEPTVVPTDSKESFLPMGEDNSKHQDDPIDDEIPLPAELQDDLLLIEAGSAVPSRPKEEELTPVAVLPPEVPAGPTYITQQYTEQPSTGDQPAGAIFDTDAYRKPLAHPAKKKSGWLLVLWIALLLIVGAGAGVAVYFYVLPMF